MQIAKDEAIETIAIDSRKATASDRTLFVAIRGDRHDGHRFLEDLYKRGIRQFIVEQEPRNPGDFPEGNFLLVPSSVSALQSIVAFHRALFSIPLIGITGSNGKTIIKEWLSQMLSTEMSVVKNPGSYNSQVGVPLSVWQLQPHHQIGIFEAGISKPGEMENLERIIRPTIGLFTNIGSAHDEGFSSIEQKIDEKLRLFRRADVTIFCSDQETVRNAIERLGIKSFRWGRTPDADVGVSFQEQLAHVRYKGQEHTLRMPFNDKASQENCMHCVAVMLYLGIPFKKIQNGVKSLRSIPMRMELKEAINQSYVIDDTYNNDLGGLELSLQLLKNQSQKQKKRLILSDVLESGLAHSPLVDRIAQLITQYPVQKFIGIGPVLKAHKDRFRTDDEFYESTEDFLSKFKFDSVNNEIILVKGARSFTFEKIISRLQRKVHGTVMEIDLGALTSNLNYFKSKLSPGTRIMVMVKAFAYGSGSLEVANMLQYHKVDYLGVAYADEGIELRKGNITIPVMVMNPSEDSFESLLIYGLEPEVYSFGILRALLTFLAGRPCTIHLKVDTGMHRLGFDPADLPEVIELLQQNPNVRVASIFSHLAAADDSGEDEFSIEQAKMFKTSAAQLFEGLGYKPLLHLLNSSGILRLPDLQFDMVRLGVGLYGIDPTSQSNYNLKPVPTLRTIVSQIKNIKAGETIGYGRRGKAEQPMKLATIAIGYADGFSRAFSRGVGSVLINGKRASIVGNVCMDMTMIDVSEIDVSEGDEVIIFGQELPIQELADKIGTIPYELLTSVSERVKRVFVSDGI